MSKFCHNCGHELKNENNKFCDKCGASLNNIENEVSLNQNTASGILCQKCGTNIPLGNFACPACGTPLYQEKHTAAILIGYLLTFFFLFFLFLSFFVDFSLQFLLVIPILISGIYLLTRSNKSVRKHGIIILLIPIIYFFILFFAFLVIIMM